MSTSARLSEKASGAARATLAVGLAEVRFVLGTFRSAFVRAAGVVSILTFVAFALAYVSSLARGGELAGESLLTHAALALMVVGYSLFTGAQGGLLAAFAVTAWKLAGPWILVPLVTIPLFVLLGLWICSPLTSAAGETLVDEIVRSGGEHHWLVSDLGVAGRAGPIVLIFAIPLFVIDLGAVMLAPSVLFGLFVLILALTLGLLVGLVPSGIVSIAAITFGYVRRFARRHGETITGAVPQREGDA
jgi:hypothetical protein